jgi:hypothetical protein
MPSGNWADVQRNWEMNVVNSVAAKLFGNNPTAAVTVITPEVARVWLTRNIGNRPVAPSQVQRLEDAIRAGKWRMTGDPIRFSKTGKLIDGQHRLHAIVNAGEAVSCLVLRDLDDDIFDVIDSGRTRSKSDLMYISHGVPVETAKILSAASLIAYAYENELYALKPRVEGGELAKWVSERPFLVDCASFAQRLPRRAAPLPRSIAAAFLFFAGSIDYATAVRFVERLMVGSVEGANDNLLHLRNAIVGAKLNRRPMQTSEIFGRLVKIWNAERRGKPIQYFNNTALRAGDPFPQFI